MNNEFAQLATALDLDWNNVTDLAKTDSRLGNTHWNVPGHDGSPGFGGACFPKDTDAMFEIAQQTNTSMTMLETAINTNNKLRN
jgi:UDPglucose 6-dehydrogenase